MITPVLTSLVTSLATVPVALWALEPPQQMGRLLLAILACVGAIGLGAMLGRAVGRTVVRWTDRRRPARRQPRPAPGVERRRSPAGPV